MSDVATKPASKTTAPAAGKGLADLFEHALKDMYYAEKKIYKSLPKMIKAAQDPDLKQSLTNHRDQTSGHIDALEQVFDYIGKRPKAEKCDAIDGILEESVSLLEDFAGTDAGDAAIIFSAQAVEHYEITRYGSMVAYAKALKLPEAAEVLTAVLTQETESDKALTSLAKGRINAAAA
ncbi:MAG: ferritin-like domain-containing protein [Pseudomonadota bacterium]